MESLIISLLKEILTDIQPGRLVESLIFLFVLIWRIKPHLKKVEDKMEGMEQGLINLEKSMSISFKNGEKRFTQIESKIESIDGRLTDIENPLKGEQYERRNTSTTN